MSKIEIHSSKPNQLLGVPFTKSLKYGSLISNVVIVAALLFLMLYKYPVTITEQALVGYDQASNQLSGTIMVNLEYSKKINRGDFVSIRLEEYPNQLLNGYIHDISYDTNKEKYQVRVELSPSALLSNLACSGKDAHGKARIIVKYESLLSIGSRLRNLIISDILQ